VVRDTRTRLQEITVSVATIAGRSCTLGWTGGTYGKGDPQTNNIASNVISRCPHNAGTAAQTENMQDLARGDTPHTHMTPMASQPYKTEEEEVQLRMPRLFDFCDHSSTVPYEAGAGTPEFVVADAAKMVVWTWTPFALSFISFLFSLFDYGTQAYLTRPCPSPPI